MLLVRRPLLRRLTKCFRIRRAILLCFAIVLGVLAAATIRTFRYLGAKLLSDWSSVNNRTVRVADTSGSVVRILHQSWKTSKLPPRFDRWSQSFSICQPNWKRRLWTDADNERLITKHFPWFLPTYRQFDMPVQKADVSRLFYMYKYGGVYCDMDCECLRPFEHLLNNISLAFAAMEGHTIDPTDDRYVEEGQIENSFMYSVPEHPFILQLIQQVARQPSGSPEQTTGPYLIMRAINQLRKTPAGIPREFRGMKYLQIFPPKYFNPFSWLNELTPGCKDKGDFTRAEELKCRDIFLNSRDSYILQYHTQVWLAGSKHQNRN